MKDMGERFMEMDGHITKIIGETGTIRFSQENQRSGSQDMDAKIIKTIELNMKIIENETVIMDSKRKWGNEEINVESSVDLNVKSNGLDMSNVEPKNLLKAGHVVQARLQQ